MMLQEIFKMISVEEVKMVNSRLNSALMRYSFKMWQDKDVLSAARRQPVELALYNLSGD